MKYKTKSNAIFFLRVQYLSTKKDSASFISHYENEMLVAITDNTTLDGKVLNSMSISSRFAYIIVPRIHLVT